MSWERIKPHETCVTCGGDFERKWHRVDAKYCSPKCRQKAHRQRAAAAREARYQVERDKRAKREARILERAIARNKPTARKRRRSTKA